ncbi:MAG: hypothetical protein ACLVJH_06070 [Faecalibacterium prausnitzii]
MVRAGGVTIAEDWGSDEADRDGEVTLHIADEYFFPWSPDTPFLYDLTVGTTQGEEEQFDTVHSYFALRKWSCAAGCTGRAALLPERQAHPAQRPAGSGLLAGGTVHPALGCGGGAGAERGKGAGLTTCCASTQRSSRSAGTTTATGWVL